MIDIKDLQALAADIDNFKVTQHMTERIKERGIKIHTIQAAMLNGEIIEQYPNDYPFPSCLILNLNPLLHVCVGLGEGKLCIITAYIPNTNAWENDFKTRKR